MTCVLLLIGGLKNLHKYNRRTHVGSSSCTRQKRATLTNGVESLSHFLLCEFERLLVSTLDNHDSLRLKNTGEGNSCTTQNNLEHVNKNEKTCDVGILSDLAVSDWDYANTGFTGNLNEDFDFERAFVVHALLFQVRNSFVVHVSENEKRVPISSVSDLWDNDANEKIVTPITQNSYDAVVLLQYVILSRQHQMKRQPRLMCQLLRESKIVISIPQNPYDDVVLLHYVVLSTQHQRKTHARLMCQLLKESVIVIILFLIFLFYCFK
ncbi:unnamed protein product [Cuscuta europaea]|uniref:Uncharacterized protein n=1 Tax=Cuscuta europaea TaxID=41803 RepID=A0A9P1E0E5_CUSEU|nr:unnamed protein product [Cuscuta europaea]